jgi:hypothetical protein
MCVIMKPRRNEEAQAHIGLSSHKILSFILLYDLTLRAKCYVSSYVLRTNKQDRILYPVTQYTDLAALLLPIEMSYSFTLKCDFIHAHNKSTAFRGQIITGLTSAQLHYVKVSLTELHLDRTTNVESTDRNTFTPISKIWLSLHRFSRR